MAPPGPGRAIDRVAGKTRWISEATGFNIGPFGVAFGVAVADGRVFADDGSTGVVALDKRTGRCFGGTASPQPTRSVPQILALRLLT